EGDAPQLGTLTVDDEHAAFLDVDLDGAGTVGGADRDPVADDELLRIATRVDGYRRAGLGAGQRGTNRGERTRLATAYHQHLSVHLFFLLIEAVATQFRAGC